jgi:hypothetical protein
MGADDDEHRSEPNEQGGLIGEERSLLERGGLEFQAQFVRAVPGSRGCLFREHFHDLLARVLVLLHHHAAGVAASTFAAGASKSYIRSSVNFY